MNKQNDVLLGEIWRPYAHLFNLQGVPAKTILLREGIISQRAFCIEKGCLRSWVNRDGKDITFQFFFEGRAVSSVESFRTHVPSLFNIETLEPCVLHILSKSDFDYILTDSEPIRKFIEQNTFRLLIHYQKLFLSYIRDRPQERYEELLKQYPQILLRVPQHYIASYLGISAVHLSRIRSKVFKIQSQ